MRLQKKSISSINLTDLLRKKKTTLESYIKENGIVTYELLSARCGSLGVVPPPEKDFLNAMGNPVTPEISSPTEGIVVLNPEQDLESPPAEEENSSLPALEEEGSPEPLRQSRKKKKNSDQ